MNQTPDYSQTVVPEIDTSAIAKTIINEIQQDMDLPNESFPILSSNWEDYVGDYETFGYGLLANELKYAYDVFSAYVQLENGIPSQKGVVAFLSSIKLMALYR